jgi:hypothetical protein
MTDAVFLRSKRARPSKDVNDTSCGVNNTECPRKDEIGLAGPLVMYISTEIRGRGPLPHPHTGSRTDPSDSRREKVLRRALIAE